jgi:hypothetical protein
VQKSEVSKKPAEHHIGKKESMSKMGSAMETIPAKR